MNDLEKQRLRAQCRPVLFREDLQTGAVLINAETLERYVVVRHKAMEIVAVSTRERIENPGDEWISFDPRTSHKRKWLVEPSYYEKKLAQLLSKVDGSGGR